jgi:hypothetical protein
MEQCWNQKVESRWQSISLEVQESPELTLFQKIQTQQFWQRMVLCHWLSVKLIKHEESDTVGIKTTNNSHISIAKCDIKSNQQAGIEALDKSFIHIENSQFSDNYLNSISLQNSSAANIVNVEFRHNDGNNISVDTDSCCIIEDCNFDQNTVNHLNFEQ